MRVSRPFLLLCVVVVVTATALAHASDPMPATAGGDAGAAAAVATRLGFSAGAAPLVVTAANGGSLSARACAACHADVAADFATTRHAAAWSNPVFQDGLRREPLQRCVHCHAPLVQQKLQAGPLGIAAPRPPTTTTSASIETSLLHEGVTCVVCHVRDGVVLVAGDVVRKDNTPMHPVRVEPALKDPALCASCHQFGFSDSDTLMQDTWGEWQRFAAGGGVGTCQSCHMPGGRHLFRGAWDVELLKRSLHVDVVDDGDRRALVLRSIDVGHHFPSGDLFRHLTVEVDDRTADRDTDRGWRDVFRIGRVFAGQGLHKRVVEDTALQPGVSRRVALPTKGPWRVRYHYAEARHERAGVVVPVVIASGD